MYNFTGGNTAENSKFQKNGALEGKRKHLQPLVTSCQFLSDSLLYLGDIIVGKQTLFPS